MLLPRNMLCFSDFAMPVGCWHLTFKGDRCQRNLQWILNCLLLFEKTCMSVAEAEIDWHVIPLS